GRSEDGDFIAAGFLERSKDGAKNDAGILVGGDDGGAGVDHFLGAIQEFGNVDALNGAGNSSEIRKRGVAAADTRATEEHAAKTIGLSDFLHVRAGVGDGDEMRCGFRGADGLLHAFEEILLEDIRLKGTTGFGGDDKNSFG